MDNIITLNLSKYEYELICQAAKLVNQTPEEFVIEAVLIEALDNPNNK